MILAGVQNKKPIWNSRISNPLDQKLVLSTSLKPQLLSLDSSDSSGSSTWCSFPTTKPMSHPFSWHDDVPCHPKLSVHTRRSGLHSQNLIPFMKFCNIDLQLQLLFDSSRTLIINSWTWKQLPAGHASHKSGSRIGYIHKQILRLLGTPIWYVWKHRWFWENKRRWYPDSIWSTEVYTSRNHFSKVARNARNNGTGSIW